MPQHSSKRTKRSSSDKKFAKKKSKKSISPSGNSQASSDGTIRRKFPGVEITSTPKKSGKEKSDGAEAPAAPKGGLSRDTHVGEGVAPRHGHRPRVLHPSNDDLLGRASVLHWHGGAVSRGCLGLDDISRAYDHFRSKVAKGPNLGRVSRDDQVSQLWYLWARLTPETLESIRKRRRSRTS